MYEEWIISRIKEKEQKGYEGAFVPAVPCQPSVEELEQEQHQVPAQQDADERGVMIIERDED